MMDNWSFYYWNSPIPNGPNRSSQKCGTNQNETDRVPIIVLIQSSVTSIFKSKNFTHTSQLRVKFANKPKEPLYGFKL